MNDQPAGILTVSALNSYVADSLRMDPLLQSVRLTGQVSNFKAVVSGHWYFSLKDEDSAIDCVLFRQYTLKSSFNPANGDQVIVHGRVGLYAATGRYQFYCDSIRPAGIGTLWRQFEEMKSRLQAEGLFDPQRKRPLPAFPRKIAVVTSESGAVWHDICHVTAARNPSVSLCLVPVPVQGEGAAAAIAVGIYDAAQIPGAELIIVGRGGGSMEDLWCFNEPEVAYAIAASPLPLISAVGHETDFTIADFVADARAATPSNAAEMAVPTRRELSGAWQRLQSRMEAAAQSCLHAAAAELASAQRQLATVSPTARLAEMDSRVHRLAEQLYTASILHLRELQPRIAMPSYRLDAAMDALASKKSYQLQQIRGRLEAVSPRQVLERGYAIAMADGKAVRQAKYAPEEMRLLFYDGSLQVRRIHHGNEEEGQL